MGNRQQARAGAAAGERTAYLRLALTTGVAGRARTPGAGGRGPVRQRVRGAAGLGRQGAQPPVVEQAGRGTKTAHLRAVEGDLRDGAELGRRGGRRKNLRPVRIHLASTGGRASAGCVSTYEVGGAAMTGPVSDAAPKPAPSPSAHPPRGEVITFYSYKGGVGRSMALANVATLLAQAQKRVVVLDFDFEAPGLHRYFATGQTQNAAQAAGMIELMYELKARLDAALKNRASEPASGLPGLERLKRKHEAELSTQATV